MFERAELELLHQLLACRGDKDAREQDLTAKLERLLERQRFMGHVFVDIPDRAALGSEDDSWVNVHNAQGMAAAVAWIRENLGPCDDNGYVCLATPGDAQEVVEQAQ